MSSSASKRLKDKGAPFYRFYYANVVKVEALSPTRVRFTFNRAGNRELPLIVGQIPSSAKALLERRDFTKTTLEPPLTSGPYRIASVDPNRGISYARVEDYWAAKTSPSMSGRTTLRNSPSSISATCDIALQGFFADSYDFRAENSAKNWATRYDVPPVKRETDRPHDHHAEDAGTDAGLCLQSKASGASSEIRRVREAFDFAFDFEWAKKNLFYDQYVRTVSYFPRSELAATGLPSQSRARASRAPSESAPA